MNGGAECEELLHSKKPRQSSGVSNKPQRKECVMKLLRHLPPAIFVALIGFGLIWDSLITGLNWKGWLVS